MTSQRSGGRALSLPPVWHKWNSLPDFNLLLKRPELNKEDGGGHLLSSLLFQYILHYIHNSKLVIAYLANILKEICFDKEASR